MKHSAYLFFYISVFPIYLIAIQEQDQSNTAGALFMLTIQLEDRIERLENETKRRMVPRERYEEYKNKFQDYQDKLKTTRERLLQEEVPVSKTKATVMEISHHLEIAKKEIEEYPLKLKPKL